jgi:lipid-binding SYLF domain-containing protein
MADKTIGANPLGKHRMGAAARRPGRNQSITRWRSARGHVAGQSHFSSTVGGGG